MSENKNTEQKVEKRKLSKKMIVLICCLSVVAVLLTALFVYGGTYSKIFDNVYISPPFIKNLLAKLFLNP